jgi:hypothetical protein
MLRYYLQLGVRSLGRNPVLTTLMITAVGVGIGASKSSACAPTPRLGDRSLKHSTLPMSAIGSPAYVDNSFATGLRRA